MTKKLTSPLKIGAYINDLVDGRISVLSLGPQTLRNVLGSKYVRRLNIFKLLFKEV